MSTTPGRTVPLLLGAVLLLLVFGAVVRPLFHRAATPRHTCPPEFGTTRMAATILWNQQDGPFPPPGRDAGRPEDLRPLAGDADAATCSAILARLPDSLLPIGLRAPRYASFYQAGELYVAPVVPRITPADMEAEVRGDTILQAPGVTFVYGPDLELLATYAN